MKFIKQQKKFWILIQCGQAYKEWHIGMRGLEAEFLILTVCGGFGSPEVAVLFLQAENGIYGV